MAATPKGRDLVGKILTHREAWLTRALTDVIDARAHRLLDEAVELLNRSMGYESDEKTIR